MEELKKRLSEAQAGLEQAKDLQKSLGAELSIIRADFEVSKALVGALQRDLDALEKANAEKQEKIERLEKATLNHHDLVDLFVLAVGDLIRKLVRR